MLDSDPLPFPVNTQPRPSSYCCTPVNYPAVHSSQNFYFHFPVLVHSIASLLCYHDPGTEAMLFMHPEKNFISGPNTVLGWDGDGAWPATLCSTSNRWGGQAKTGGLEDDRTDRHVLFHFMW